MTWTAGLQLSRPQDQVNRPQQEQLCSISWLISSGWPAGKSEGLIMHCRHKGHFEEIPE